MKNLLLLTCAALLYSKTVYAVCNPNLPACQCAYPKMVNGIIGCGPSYCENGTKCMPNGSCCPEGNYCESTEKHKECCTEGKTCDTTKGCVEEKADIGTLCDKAGGFIEIDKNGKKFCFSDEKISWQKAKDWCENNGMRMPTAYELCQNWSGTFYTEECPNIPYVIEDPGFGWLQHHWTSSLTNDGQVVVVSINEHTTVPIPSELSDLAAIVCHLP